VHGTVGAFLFPTKFVMFPTKFVINLYPDFYPSLKKLNNLDKLGEKISVAYFLQLNKKEEKVES